jgi:membrane protein CcdC involved in cytochrome C biogenesis
MLLWVIVPSLALLIISPGQEMFIYRLVYLIPFQILAAIGLNSIFNKLKDVERKFKLSATYSYVLRILLFTLIVLLLLNYSLRSVDEAIIYINPTP